MIKLHRVRAGWMGCLLLGWAVATAGAQTATGSGAGATGSETLPPAAIAELEASATDLTPRPTVPVEPERAETPEERNQRLIEKHLSPLDRNFFNRITLPIIGEPNAVRAQRLEREQEIREFRKRMEPILNGLRQTDPAEYRVVRDAYHETLYRLYRHLRGE